MDFVKKCTNPLCNSKLKLSDLSCNKCDNKYCIKHRLPEFHSCSYDFKQEKINLVKVVADKLIKI